MIPPRQAGVSLEGVSLTYPGGTVALAEISLRVEPGRFAVLLGPSGSGKSSLLRCINGLVTPTSGTVRVGEGDPSPVPGKSLRERRREIGMIFQLHHLIGRRTALENVLQGRLAYHSVWRTLWPFSRAETRMALECLDRVGMIEKAMVRADRLSGGEKQRVGIARALVQRPRLMLADEPVASLDPVQGERIMSLLARVCSEDGLTALVSLHQVELARRFADRIIGLSAGKVVYDGPPRDLTPPRLEAIYRGASRAPSVESPALNT
jgi:phosphonate transport system ATP-binding protein